MGIFCFFFWSWYAEVARPLLYCTVCNFWLSCPKIAPSLCRAGSLWRSCKAWERWWLDEGQWLQISPTDKRHESQQFAALGSLLLHLQQCAPFVEYSAQILCGNTCCTYSIHRGSEKIQDRRFSEVNFRRVVSFGVAFLNEIVQEKKTIKGNMIFNMQTSEGGWHC